MRYLILLAALSMPVFAQTVLTVTERKVTVAGGQSYSSFKSNDETLKAASSLAAQVCAVNPNSKVYGRITFEYTCAKPSSSRKSSASSSSVSSSVSSQSSSSLPAIVRVPLTFGRPVARENGDVLTVDEIKHYVLDRNSGFSTIQSKEDLVTVQIDPPAENETLYLTTVDTDNVYSKRVAVEK